MTGKGKGFRSYGLEVLYSVEMAKGIKAWRPIPRVMLSGDAWKSSVDAVDPVSGNVYAAWATGRDVAPFIQPLIDTQFGIMQGRIVPLPETALLFNGGALGINEDMTPGQYFALKTAWQDREKARFASGQYIQVPWFEDDLPDYRCAVQRIKTVSEELGHFLHVAENDNRKIAFTESNDKGLRDIQTVMNPGKYLSRFCRQFGLNSSSIAFLTAYYGLKYGEENPVKFATTEDEIVAVYTNGPRSCMAGEDDGYTSDRHPCRVYAAGDLAVAYMEKETPSQDDDDYDDDDEDEDGEPLYVGSGSISARCIVWPEKKIYARIYGDEVRLSFKLKALGYREYEHPSDWNGAKLLRIKQSDMDHSFHAPYVDVADGRVKITKSHFVINYDSYDCRMRETNGIIRCDTGERECYGCGNEFHEDDMECIDGNYICATCHPEYVWSCPCCEGLYLRGSVAALGANDNGTNVIICEDCAQDGDFHICRTDGLLYSARSMVRVMDSAGSEAWIAECNMEKVPGLFECSVMLCHYLPECLAGYHYGLPVSFDGERNLFATGNLDGEAWVSVSQIDADEMANRLQLPLPLSHPNEIVCDISGPFTPLHETENGLEPCIPGLADDWNPLANVNEMSNRLMIWNYHEPRIEFTAT